MRGDIQSVELFSDGFMTKFMRLSVKGLPTLGAEHAEVLQPAH